MYIQEAQRPIPPLIIGSIQPENKLLKVIKTFNVYPTTTGFKVNLFVLIGKD